MRSVLIVVGVLLVAVAAIILWRGSGQEVPRIEAPLSVESMMRDSGLSSVVENQGSWQAFDVDIDDEDVKVHARAFSKPVAAKEVIDRFDYSGDPTVTAIGLYVIANRKIREIEHTEQGIDEYIETVFADVDEAKARYEEQQASVGGWENFAEALDKIAADQYEQMMLLGEAVVDSCHILIVRRHPNDKTALYIVSQRDQTGRFTPAVVWPKHVDGLLTNGKILELMPSIQEEFPN